jgi:hypothetical protein
MGAVPANAPEMVPSSPVHRDVERVPGIHGLIVVDRTQILAGIPRKPLRPLASCRLCPFLLSVADWVKFGEDTSWNPALPGNPIRGEKCELKQLRNSGLLLMVLEVFPEATIEIQTAKQLSPLSEHAPARAFDR